MQANRIGSTSCVTQAPLDPSEQTSGVEGTLLPDPEVQGSGEASIEGLATLLAQADEQDRTQARELEQTSDHAATVAESARVQQLYDKANDEGREALFKGLGDVAGGLCELGSAFTTASDAAGRSGAFDWRTALSGGSRLAPGVGTILSATATLASGRADASAASFDAQSQADLRSYDAARDQEQAANDSVQKVDQFLDQVQQAENAARLAAATYRA